jgi:hypothetical protein
MKQIAVWTALALVAPVFAPLTASAQARIEGRVELRLPEWHREAYQSYNHSHWNKDFRGRWTPLGGQYNAQTDVQSIHLDGRKYSKLRVEGAKGEPVIQRMTVTFGDRSTQTVDLNMRLSPGTGEVIDLNGIGDRKILQIMVYSAPHTRGSFSIYAG